MLRNVLLILLLVCSGAALAADEPSLHQVYTAANAGRLSEAQGMMDQVLRLHPGSAKAHFVEAEILSRGGHFANARTELDTAERLAPGLPFAKPESVEKLKRNLSAARMPESPVQASTADRVMAPAAGGIPWAMVLLGLGLIAVLIFFVRSMSRRPVVYSGGGPGYAGGPGGMPAQPYGAGPIGAGPMGAGMGPAAGGMGSGILGGLATGAAVGAGMVAGEALMHHFTDSGNAHAAPMPAPAENWSAPPDDMGGGDFGVSDSGSWDDGSSGGSDW